MTKIIVSTNKGGLEDTVNPVFGRCQTFTTVEIENKEIRKESIVVEQNPGASMSHGAGIQASQFAVDKKAEIVITGNTGPNAYNVLKQAGIRLYSAPGTNVLEALEKYLAGELKEITVPQGRFGCRGHRHGATCRFE